MRCEEAASALVDDRARRSEELNAHVASCEACRGVLALDAFARELVRFDPVPLIRAPDLTAEVTRRMRIRFAFVTVGILGVGERSRRMHDPRGWLRFAVRDRDRGCARRELHPR